MEAPGLGGRAGPDAPLIEIREWGRPARRFALTQPTEFGRDCDGELLDDSEVSRRHLRLVASPTALSAVDLGSRNGTMLNGVALHGRASLRTGDVIRIGRSEIIVLDAPIDGPRDDDADHADEYDAARQTLRPVTSAPIPPPPASAERPASTAIAIATRLLDIERRDGTDPFAAFTELPSRVPRWLWPVARVVSLGAFVTLAVALFVRPVGGLFVLFGVIVPLLPVLFLGAPGFWRNVCPLATWNQLPRVLGFARAGNPPDVIYGRGYLIAVALFFGIAGSRLAGLDRTGAAAGVALVGAGSAALVGGVFYKGKSGWCSSICPLFPLQRAYGQTPFVTVPNRQCPSCVGCAKNCYDFRPVAAYQADLVDTDRSWSGPRKLFAAALPGFVLGFFNLAGDADRSLPGTYALLALVVLVAVGSFFAIEAVTPLSPSMLTAGYVAVALNGFYWFAGPVIAASAAEITGVEMAWVRWPISAAILLASSLWLARTRVRELQFAVATGVRTEPVALPFPRRRPDAAAPAPAAQVRFGAEAPAVAADSGASLLEVAERVGLPIEAGCRMGVCGADPVAVLDGTSCLSPPDQDERNTLRRLGFAANTRMACCARLDAGSVTVSLTPEPGDGAAGPGAADRAGVDRSIVSVVVIGNGIAGVTAADFVRRGHPDCEIHLVGREPHGLYNRMGISRLVYGRSAMHGLSLLPDGWYDDHAITAWLNTLVTKIDVEARRVHLGTGQVIPYDRLILAMGAASAVPPIPGLDRPGCFVLREAGDAMQLRAYVQRHRGTRAVVAGAGLLGLEAAYALRQLGLGVTVLERNDRLLHRQVDARCSEMVRQHLQRLGIDVQCRSEAAQIAGDPAVTSVTLADGRVLDCDIVLTAVGIRPNVDLAREAGIPVGNGVLVDDRMQTNVAGVYAAGDVAEHRGTIHGLWPIAAEQAQAAAVNALGGDMEIVTETPATILKGVGLGLFAIGRTEAKAGDDVITVEGSAPPSYRRLVLMDGRAVGAVILGPHPADQAAVHTVVRNRLEVPVGVRSALRAGDWSPLHHLATAASQPA
ncbi:FAD-dependent oxidoreductase [Desertimonas flava]|uniref:FAD-dependent oxidoreductase n=1 Tax=Desertimonas flava TaxID=2064846 RepID=UPI0019693457|nr:FAD-dependent oxidoreductase [Desertimonas flava]